MIEQIELGQLIIEVTKKDIKNLHLNVYPPNGKVCISSPRAMDIEHIRAFAISKLDWIKRQQKNFDEQKREPSRQYIDRESHYFWGQRYLLKVIEDKSISPMVELKHNQIYLYVRPGANKNRKRALIDSWYRTQLKQELSPLINKWEQLLEVKVDKIFVQKMKTKWGSCNHRTKYIRFNTELAKKPKECLEYIVAHEITHLIEHTHNSRFIALMDQFLPSWRLYKDILNQSSLGHEVWKY